MRPIIYQITGFQAGYLAIMGRPRSGEWLEEEIKGLSQLGIHILVSLLQSEEIRELELTHEERLCQQSEIEYISYPVPDRGVPPSMSDTFTLTTYLYDHLLNKKGVCIHCRAGIGRSSLLAACILVHASYSPEQALISIAQARHVPVPDTTTQQQWITAYYHQYIQEKDNNRSKII